MIHSYALRSLSVSVSEPDLPTPSGWYPVLFTNTKSSLTRDSAHFQPSGLILSFFTSTVISASPALMLAEDKTPSKSIGGLAFFLLPTNSADASSISFCKSLCMLLTISLPCPCGNDCANDCNQRNGSRDI